MKDSRRYKSTLRVVLSFLHSVFLCSVIASDMSRYHLARMGGLTTLLDLGASIQVPIFSRSPVIHELPQSISSMFTPCLKQDSISIEERDWLCGIRRKGRYR